MKVSCEELFDEMNELVEKGEIKKQQDTPGVLLIWRLQGNNDNGDIDIDNNIEPHNQNKLIMHNT